MKGDFEKWGPEDVIMVIIVIGVFVVLPIVATFGDK